MNAKLMKDAKRIMQTSYTLPALTRHEKGIDHRFRECRNRGKRAIFRYRSVMLKLGRYMVPTAYVQLGNNIATRAENLPGVLRYHRMERHRRRIVQVFEHVAWCEARAEFLASPKYRRLVNECKADGGGTPIDVFHRRLETVWIPYEIRLQRRLRDRYRDFETLDALAQRAQIRVAQWEGGQR